MSWLKSFYKKLDKKYLESTTTKDIVEKILSPPTTKGKDSLADYVRKLNPAVVGKASVYICYSSSMLFKEFMESLIHYFEKSGEGDDVIVWIDFVSWNKHLQPSAELSEEWFTNTLKSMISSVDKIVLIQSPWNSFLPLKRTWCLWELFCALDTRRTLAVAMTAESENEVIRSIDGSVKGVVTDLHESIDSGKSECSESGEREKLLEVMQKSVGLVEVNKRVGHGLSGWLCEFYGKEYERRKRDLGEENEETRKAEAILKALDESR